MSIIRARELRQNMTPPERAMWRILKTVREGEFHFRRQVPLGPYYADFACHHAKLVIEVDGDTHGTETVQMRDERRDAYLRERGFTVLRFSNAEVVSNPEGVFEVLADKLAAHSSATAATPTPAPSPQGGEEQKASPSSQGELSGETPIPNGETK